MKEHDRRAIGRPGLAIEYSQSIYFSTAIGVDADVEGTVFVMMRQFSLAMANVHSD